MSEHNIRALAVMLEKAATFVVGKPQIRNCQTARRASCATAARAACRSI
jgi:hypothetical protein